jgi:phage gp36-like protein
MAWITLSEADVKGALTSDELSKYREAGATEAETDPLTPILANAELEVRGYVGARYPMATTGIPDVLKNDALDIVVHRLAKRLNFEEGEQRKKAYDDAIEKLTMVAKGDLPLAIDTPEAAADPPESVGGAELVNYTERVYTGSELSGIY